MSFGTSFITRAAGTREERLLLLLQRGHEGAAAVEGGCADVLPDVGQLWHRDELHESTSARRLQTEPSGDQWLENIGGVGFFGSNNTDNQCLVEHFGS